ncbi:MAG: ABC-F family ATP-binding cassette domain-containing protein [Puniceicoccales bacterium]|jgi:ATP-binding cassette subfamily F protein 3|nr:ABC-F family ATP-binding cassette domain-containing protein [Puniceicoccales bacterium]
MNLHYVNACSGMIDIENLTHRVGGRILFENATLHLPSQGKVGIVGPNGCGKTTLFRLVLGQEKIDSGEIYVKNGMRLVCIKQEIENGEISLLDSLINTDLELIQLRKILNSDQCIPAEELADAYDRYEAIGGYSAEARAASILSGLGFRQNDLQKKLSEFSGGWQMRAALAATLFAPSDCLLLDEPTNHLDFETAMWFENYLKNLSKTILMISHEKQFLNKICNYIISVHDRQLHLFKGNYDTYIDARSNQKVALVKNIENLQKKRQHMQNFIDRFGVKATKAKQAQSRLKMIEKMEIPEMPSSEHRVKFSFPQPKPQVDRKLITLENVSAGYGGKIVLHSINLCITLGDRIALLGSNGNGKSTLAKIISGRLTPHSGEIIGARNVKISYFSQQQADELNLEKTPIEIFRNTTREFSETQIRAHLGRFGITQERSETAVKNLSGGEKSRVLFAINSLSNPHAMIFDEPTNHLDIETREALINAINEYHGAVVLITHDFYILSKICSKFFIIADGRCSPFGGSLEDYREFLLTGNNRATAKAANREKETKTKLAEKQKEKELLALGKTIAALETKKKEFEEILSKSYDHEACDSYADCCKRLVELENKWLELQE